MAERVNSIFLDTNVLHQGWPHLSVKVRNLLEAARKLGIVVGIPQPTLTELFRNWRDATKSFLEDATEGFAALDRLDSSLSVVKQIPEWKAYQAAYDERVNALITEWGIVVPLFPGISLEAVFEQATEKHLLFGSKGLNFQDVVILHSVIEYVSEKTLDACLVTEDAGFDKRKKDWDWYAKSKGAKLDCKPLAHALNTLTERFSVSEQERIATRRALAKKAVEGYLPNFQKSFNEHLERIKTVRFHEQDPWSYHLQDAQFETVADVAVSHLITPPATGSEVKISAIVRGKVLRVERQRQRFKMELFEVGFGGTATYLEDGYSIKSVSSTTYGSPGMYETVLLPDFDEK